MSRICFIGGGNMTQAIIGGFLAKGGDASQLAVVEPNAEARTKLSALGVSTMAAWLPPRDPYSLVVLAVKPQVLCEAIRPLREGAGGLGGAVVLSIAAGVRTDSICQWLGDYRRVIRAMPNTPAMIGAGITALYAMEGIGEAERASAATLMRAVGKTFWLDDEPQLDAVTAVSGSGPAYVFYFIEALEAAAIELGLAPDIARTLAIETFRGGAMLAASSSDAPATLRANVTSKRGTTERALAHFAAEDIAARMIVGVKAAASRAKELGDEMAAASAEKIDVSVELSKGAH
jgi:pyrroline-5-carboxylate reductase